MGGVLYAAGVFGFLEAGGDPPPAVIVGAGGASAGYASTSLSEHLRLRRQQAMATRDARTNRQVRQLEAAVHVLNRLH